MWYKLLFQLTHYATEDMDWKGTVPKMIYVNFGSYFFAPNCPEKQKILVEGDGYSIDWIFIEITSCATRWKAYTVYKASWENLDSALLFCKNTAAVKPLQKLDDDFLLRSRFWRASLTHSYSTTFSRDAPRALRGMDWALEFDFWIFWTSWREKRISCDHMYRTVDDAICVLWSSMTWGILEYKQTHEFEMP